MSETEQQIAIAEFCEIKVTRFDESIPSDKQSVPYSLYYNGVLHHTGNIPDYLRDLNAIHEAWLLLGDFDKREFHVRLALIMEKQTPDWNAMQLLDQRSLITNAPCPQRCEALLRTISKWKE